MRSLRALTFVSLMVFANPSGADELWGITSAKHPFEGVQALRAAGYEVHVLLVDLSEQTMDGIRASVKTSKRMSQRQLHAVGQQVRDTVDVTIIEKSLKSDIATRVLIKKMGVKSIPAVIRYQGGEMTVHYGELDLVQSARQLDFIR